MTPRNNTHIHHTVSEQALAFAAKNLANVFFSGVDKFRS